MPSRRADAGPPTLESLVERFGGMVRAVGARHGLDPNDADELVQEVRIRLWRARGAEGAGLEGIGSSYVYRTAVAAAIDMIRARRARRGVPLASVEATPAAVRQQDAADRDLERAELANAMRRALENLSDSRRPAVRMYLAGYDHREIADLLGWSEAKARNLLYRGLADLREQLVGLGVSAAGWS